MNPKDLDIKAWASGLAAILAAIVAFVQSEQWQTAALVLIGASALAFVVYRIGQLTDEVQQCRASHAECDRKLAQRDVRLARRDVCMAVMHNHLQRCDPTIPPLQDLLGEDAQAAQAAANQVSQTARKLGSIST